MKFSFSLAAVVVGVGLTGVAQDTPRQFHAKPTGEFKVKEQVKEPKEEINHSAAQPASGKGESSERQLQKIEQQKVKATPHPKKLAAAGLKPEQSKPNPKINFGGGTGTKNASLNNQGTNPYKGRLKQKGPQSNK
jgi:hypothetical protein